ncbi:MAG: helix-turn-helix transcriptional regulator [Eubacteriales bacterium]
MEKRLRELRKSRRVTQDMLGYEIGMSQQNISRYEKSIETIPVDMLIKFSDYYKVTTDYLLGISDIRNRPTINEETQENLEYNDFANVYATLSEYDKELLWSMMKKMKELNLKNK